MTRSEPNPDLPSDPAFAAALETYSLAERGRAIKPSSGFADRVSKSVQSDRAAVRQYRRTLVAAVVSLAAAVLLAVGVIATHSPDRPAPTIAKKPVEPVPVPPSAVPPPRMGDAFADAGEALASLSQRTADKAARPTRSILGAGWGGFAASPSAAVPDVRPAADTLASVPSSARSSVEPLTSNTRRAIGLFLRDTGLQSSKSKS